MKIHGHNQIGFDLSADGEAAVRAVNPATGEPLPGEFRLATPLEAERACAKAATAFSTFGKLPGKDRAAFLEAIAEAVMEIWDPLQSRLALETAYPPARITGERDRTLGQLRQFAALLREGSWVRATLDHAQPDRPTGRKPDIRQFQSAIGPVIVFGASNFPQAFSTAGGDTASALAAGCPVIVKAHRAHPGVAELYASAIVAAAKRTGMPDGVFSKLNATQETAMALVKDPRIQAIGFTGSFHGGKALFDAAVARPQPIPVYAEMSSSNPVFMLPDAMATRNASLAEGYAQSLTLGVGQFCTNPGLVVTRRGPEADAFIAGLVERLRGQPVGTMVHASIKKGYAAALADKRRHASVRLIFQSAQRGAHPDTDAPPTVFQTSAKEFLAHPEIAAEIFGPGCVVVLCDDGEEMLRVAGALDGQLTATVHGTDQELAGQGPLFALLERKAGRLIVNGYPTGVEVCPSMHHGGPYPATTFPHFTSVGTNAIYRFTRPVCYQDFPDGLLPMELREGNPLGIWRLADGEFKR